MRSRPTVVAASPPSVVIPPMYSKNELTLRPMPSRPRTLARSTSSAGFSTSFKVTDTLHFREHALRGLDAAHRNTALGSQIEMHLIYLLKTLVDVAQMRTRLLFEARKIPPHGGDIVFTRGLVHGVRLQSGFDLLLRGFQGLIRHVKLADPSDERAQTILAHRPPNVGLRAAGEYRPRPGPAAHRVPCG